MNDVNQVKRQLSFGKPASPLYESPWLSSPVSIDREKGSLNESSHWNKPKMQIKNGTFNIGLLS